MHGFSQTDTVEFLIDERKLTMIKLRLANILSHLSTALNSKKLFNALPREWLAPSTTLPLKMARGIRRTVQMNTSRCQKFTPDSFQKGPIKKLQADIIYWN